MKIATWNVNSIRQRLAHVKDWLEEARPDVLGLQEIKVVTEAFPAAEFEALGYRCAVDGQKAYNGVALLSRTEPRDIVCGLPGFADEQKRALAASYGDLRLLNLYVPNGQSVGSEKYEYKLRWLAALRDYLRAELDRHPNVAVMGDFNIAPEDRDVHDPEAWRGQVLCSEPERERLGAIAALGFADLFRRFEQPDKAFSWWDYRAAAFRRNRGLRIDLILASPALTGRCVACAIDSAPRGREQPSDHTPVWATFQ
ncbi:MAG: exodeoxyribonuclease III [Gammaproteobacteria bacterium]|nr:MAG: exodeoxyribonuclease III [Gammaproteobacteria bacterium]